MASAVLVGMAPDSGANPTPAPVLDDTTSPRARNQSDGLLSDFIRGLKSVPDLTALAQFLGLSTVYWAFNGFAIWLIAPSFRVPFRFLWRSS